MFIKQVSVFIENKKGRLAALTKELANSGRDLKALSISDTADFGILRFLSNETEEILPMIKAKGFTATVTDVIAAEVEDKPGGLADMLEILDEAGISIEYLYSFVLSKHGSALIIFRAQDNDVAVELLKAKGIKLVDQNWIDSL
jgi:hypothetical protein